MWTYSGDPTSSLLDAVRYTIGDTIETDPLLQDEEVQYELTQAGSNVLQAAVRCCEAIAAKFARLADSTMGQTSINASQKYAQYTALASHLRRKAAIKATPYSGSTDTVAIFDKGMMDHKGALVEWIQYYASG